MNFKLLGGLLLLVGSPALALGCNAKVATVLESEEGAIGGHSDGGASPAVDGGGSVVTQGDSGEGTSGSGSCAAKGGVCLPPGASAPPNRRMAAPGEATCPDDDACWLLVETKPVGPACSSDAQCNDDPAQSSLSGHCYNGICVCKPGFHVQPSGRCNVIPPPGCGAHQGTCEVVEKCGAGKLAGSQPTNLSCGDEDPVACCIDEASCFGPAKEGVPVSMVCCAPNDATTPPICVNGWRTCPPGYLATMGGCG